MEIIKSTDNGRRLETRVEEKPVDFGTERVTEHLEEVVPLQLVKRVREVIKPVAVERIVEDASGNIVSRETSNPNELTPSVMPALVQAIVDAVQERTPTPVATFRAQAEERVLKSQSEPLVNQILWISLAVLIAYLFHALFLQ